MAIEMIPKRFKFARRANWIFLVGAILSPVYIYYCAKIANQGNFSEHYFKYYMISLVGILFWGGALWLKDQIKLNIVMVVVSLMIGVYLVEVVLSFIAPSIGYSNIYKLRQAAAKADGVEYDTRMKYQVYRDLGSAGIDVVPSFHPNLVPSFESLLPLAGVSEKVTLFCNESGNYSIFRSDRYGFNNPDAEWDSPQIEWVLVGDSFTQGACVQPGEDIAGQIRLITGEGVLSLGIGGNGPLIELGTLKEYAELSKPKKVLWVYFEGNDMVDLAREASVPLRMRYLRSEFSQKLIHRQREIDSLINKYVIEAERGNPPSSQKSTVAEAVIKETRLLRLPNIRQRIGFDGSVDPLFIKVLTQARDQTAAWGGKLYFIYLPEFKRYSTRVLNQDWYRNRGEVIKIARSLNLPVIDVHQEIFANHPDPLALFSFRLSAHYNAEGYSEVAKAIVSGVREKKQRRSP